MSYTVPSNRKSFVDLFNAFSHEVHANAVDKGFWDARHKIVELCSETSSELGEAARQAIDGQAIALMHSELSEALEASRHGNPPDDHIPEFTGLEAELADVIIRIGDLAAARDLRIGEAIVAKLEYNSKRERLHGKKF